MIHLNDYTAAELEQMLADDRDIILGHGEDKVYIEMPEAKLEKELTAKDGVLIASEHKAKVKDMFPARAKKSGKAYVRLATNRRLDRAGISGMTGKQLKALLKATRGKLVDKKDVPFPEPEPMDTEKKRV